MPQAVRLDVHAGGHEGPQGHRAGAVGAEHDGAAAHGVGHEALEGLLHGVHGLVVVEVVRLDVE